MERYRLVFRRTGGPEVIDREPLGALTPGPGEVLIRHEAIGASVIAHAGSQEKARIAADLGADHALSCTFDELAAQVKAVSAHGVACVFDGIGAASWAASMACLRRRGLMISFGNASGPV